MDKSINTIQKRIDYVKEILLKPFDSFEGRKFFIGKDNIDPAWPNRSFSDKKIKGNTTLGIKKFVLNIDIHSGILLELKDLNVFHWTETIRVIAQLISAQPNGEDGDLVTNGCPNIFFTESPADTKEHPFTIRVLWSKDKKMWILEGRKPFYTNDSKYDPVTSAIFIHY